jgi:hypothetical protein
MPQDGIHTKGKGPWHECGRCGRRAKLRSELQWQRNVLVCYDCHDKRLLGSYDASVSAFMSTLIDNPDMAPDPKLSNPDIESLDDDIVF